MSRETVEFVKRVYAEWAAGNFAAGTEAYDRQIVLAVRPEFPDTGLYTGILAIREYMRAFLEPWESLTIEGTGFRPLGDSVLVRVSQRGTGRASGAQTAFSYYHLWTLREDKVIRIDVIMSEDEALAAAAGQARQPPDRPPCGK